MASGNEGESSQLSHFNAFISLINPSTDSDIQHDEQPLDLSVRGANRSEDATPTVSSTPNGSWPINDWRYLNALNIKRTFRLWDGVELKRINDVFPIAIRENPFAAKVFNTVHDYCFECGAFGGRAIMGEAIERSYMHIFRRAAFADIDEDRLVAFGKLVTLYGLFADGYFNVTLGRKLEIDSMDQLNDIVETFEVESRWNKVDEAVLKNCCQFLGTIRDVGNLISNWPVLCSLIDEVFKVNNGAAVMATSLRLASRIYREKTATEVNLDRMMTIYFNNIRSLHKMSLDYKGGQFPISARLDVGACNVIAEAYIRDWIPAHFDRTDGSTVQVQETEKRYLRIHEAIACCAHDAAKRNAVYRQIFGYDLPS